MRPRLGGREATGVRGERNGELSQCSPHASAALNVCLVRIFIVSLLFGAVLGLAACRSAPKSSARIYEGNAPSIKFHESHAGGPIGSY